LLLSPRASTGLGGNSTVACGCTNLFPIPSSLVVSLGGLSGYGSARIDGEFDVGFNYSAREASLQLLS